MICITWRQLCSVYYVYIYFDIYELDYFDIFYDFQHFRTIFSILLCCFDKLSLSHLIFSTN